MKKHFAKLLLLGAMIVAGFSFVGCNDIEKELADLNNKVENLESESAKNLQDAINALNAKLASDYALKTDVSALEIALKGTIAEQVAVAEAKINKAIEDAIAACKAESADAIAKVSADLAKVSEELTAVAGDVKAATAKIDENAAAIAGVDAKVLELKGTIDALADYLDTLEGMARENKATLDSFAEYFAEYKGEVDMKLTELHGSLGALSVYLEELEASIDARFAEHQNTFLALSAFLEEHEIEVDAKFAEILGTFDALAAHLEEREAKIDFALEEINGTFAALSPVIETMQAQIKETHNTLEALADYLDEKEAETQLALEQLHGQLEALSPVIETMQAQIEENHQTLLALSDFLEKADYQGQIDSLKADVAASIAMARELDQTLRFDLAAHIKTLEDQLAALEGGQVDLDAVKAEVNAVINQLVEDLTGRVANLENRIQSIAYVPQSTTAVKAQQYTVGEEATDYIIKAAYQVSPVAAAADLKNADVYFKGLSVKAEAPAKYNANVLSVDEATGMVEALCYVPAETFKPGDKAVVLALAVENNAGVEITSGYESFEYAETPLATVVTIENNTHAIKYDTPIAESKVELINALEFVVNHGTLFVDTPLAEALEFLGFDETLTVVRNPENRFGKDYITEVVNASEYDPNANVEDDEFDVLKATVSEDRKNVTAEFSADYSKVADASKLVGASISFTLKEGYFTLAGEKLPKVDVSYTVVGNEKSVVVDIDDIESAWLPVAKWIDVPYSGMTQSAFNAASWTVAIKDADDETVPGTVTVNATSHDDVTVTLGNDFAWPEVATTYTIVGEWSELDPETQTTTVYSFEFALALEAKPADVEYATDAIADLTLTAAPNPLDPNDLGKQPNGNANTPATLASKVVVGELVTDLIADYADLYEEGELEDLIEVALEAATWTVNKLDIDTDVVGAAITLNEAPKFVYVPATDTEVEKSEIVFKYNVADYTALKGQHVQLSTSITDLNGVDYTIVTNAEVSAWTVPTEPVLVPTVKLNSFYSTELVSENPFTWTTKRYPYQAVDANGFVVVDKNGDKVNYYEQYTTPVVPGTPVTDWNYSVEGNTHDILDYILLENVADADKSKFEYVLTFIDNTKYNAAAPTATTADYKSRFIENNNTPILEDAYRGELKNADLIVLDSKTGNNTVKINYTVSGHNYINLKWNDVKVSALTVNVALADKGYNDYQKALAAYLAANTGKTETDYLASISMTTEQKPKAYNNIDVTFKSKNGGAAPVEFGEFKQLEGKYVANGTSAAVNVAQAITVEDIYDQVVNNPGATTLSEVWSSYVMEAVNATDVAATPYIKGYKYSTAATPDSFFKVYGQEVEMVENPAVGKTGFYETDFTGTVNVGSNGNVTIVGTGTELAKDVEITVWVKLTHMFDVWGEEAEVKPVTIKFPKTI